MPSATINSTPEPVRCTRAGPAFALLACLLLRQREDSAPYVPLPVG